MPGQLSLDGRVAVVTGSSRGWGEATAKLLAHYGAKVIINGRTAHDVDRVVHDIRNKGHDAVGIAESVATMAGAERIIMTAVHEFGRVDILVNNAGALRPSLVTEMAEESWDEVINTQLKGTFACTKFAAKQMIRSGSGGRIINVAGGAAVRGLFANANHAASKGGVIAATRTWAMELAPHSITVNAVRGRVNTKTAQWLVDHSRTLLDQAGLPSASEAAMGFFEPEESAQLIVWLASEPAKHITGQFFGVDGPRMTMWSYAQPFRVAYMFPHWTVEALCEVFEPFIRGDLQEVRSVTDEILDRVRTGNPYVV